MSAIVARREKTSPFHWPLLLTGLALMVVYAADTFAASMYTYLPFDVPVERFIQSINWGPLVSVFLALDWTEGTRQDILGVAGILVIAAVNWRAVPMVVFAALSVGVYVVTAMVINRPRPSDQLVHVIRHTGSSSYPSGHVAFFSWFIIMLVVCLAFGRLPNPVVAVLSVMAALLLAIVCIGRIYLGEHWPSDVIGGLALGLGFTAIGMSFRFLSNPVLARKK
ncbi:MAG TPA: phosphatase PAP2 family protein [Candidatus Micrarchaeaceae archaeon]|nr:phosphatase PAP2 family protein [Candidatus Micrarchaeaceae archaeon]